MTLFYFSDVDSPKPGSFWDVVVLTAVDEGQRVAYELQLKEKLDRGTIPHFCHYHVFADPPGPKAGRWSANIH